MVSVGVSASECRPLDRARNDESAYTDPRRYSTGSTDLEIFLKNFYGTGHLPCVS